MNNQETVIDTCDLGHKFAKLPDNPVMADGLPRCPHCMAAGLDRARQRITELESDAYMELLLQADRLLRRYIDALVTNQPEVASAATQAMVDYVMAQTPTHMSVVSHAAHCDLLKPSVISTPTQGKIYVARNCTCGAVEKAQADAEVIKRRPNPADGAPKPPGHNPVA